MLSEMLLSLLLIVIYLVLTYSVARVLESVGRSKQAAPMRAVYISKVFNFLIATFAVILLSLVWGVDYGSVFVLASSVLAVIGVALFAQWSILSNITASIVIFFAYPSKIGDRIRIVDGDNSIEGEIVNINLFQVLIRNSDSNLVNYPNNLIIQKPVIRLDHVPAPIEKEKTEEPEPLPSA